MADNHPSATASGRTPETPYTSIKVLPRRTSDDQPQRISRFFDEPRRVQRAREESQEDALGSVRHFFAPEMDRSKLCKQGQVMKHQLLL